MKQATSLFFAAFLAVLLFSSCNKEDDWECECDIAGDRTVTAVYSDEKKSDAKEKCKQFEKQNAMYTNCKIK